MKLVRVVSETPSDAAALISFLENHGFEVQTGQVSDPNAPVPDFELDLRVLPIDAALHLAREMASGEVDVFIGSGALADPQPEIGAVSVQAENEIAEEELVAFSGEQPAQSAPEPVSVIASRRLRESVGQVLREARLTTRECLALCSAELLNSSEQAGQWLAQARVLLVRKRALVETRAIRARAIVENSLRFDSASQNAWIRSAFAGAGLMIVLLALMLWKDQRFASASSGTVPSPGAASLLRSTPSAAPSAEAGTSAPVGAGLHRRLPSDRADILGGREVIIRHFGRPSPKSAAVIDTKSGIKHISDMN